jgi:hypothetical protein
MAESAALQLQKSPGSAIKLVETICHAMGETLGEIQTTVDEEQSVPSIFMTAIRDLREGQNRAAALEESSDKEDAKVMDEELSRQSLHHRQNVDQESRSLFACTFHIVAMEGRSAYQRKKRKRVKKIF